MENDAATRIETKLDAIIHLLAAPLVQGKSVADSAQVLAKVGLNSVQIAELCNTTPGVVRKALSRARLHAKSKRPHSASKRARTAGTAQ